MIRKYHASPIEKISNRQLSLILFMMRTTIAIGFLPVLTSADALQDAWASVIITFFGTMLIALFISGLGTKFPGMTVIEYSQRILGKWLGGFISLIYLWSFLWMASIDLRLYGEVITSLFLTRTPLVFITGVMVLTAILGAFGGIETIGRTADFFGIIFIIAIIGTILSLIPNSNFEWLQPMLSRGPGPVLRGSIIPIALGAYLLTLFILIPTTETPKKATRSVLLSIIGSSLVLIAVTILVITTLGPHIGSITYFPLFKAIRAIEISDLFERIEMFIIFSWGFGLYIGVSTYLYCGARGVQQLLGLKTYRPIVAPMAVMWVILSINSFDNDFIIMTFLQPKVMGSYYFSLIFIPTLTLWIGYIIQRFRGKLPKPDVQEDTE